MKRIFKALGLTVAVTFSISATNNWNTHVEVTERAYVLGNPDAEVSLIEFVSYTCPHCATFTIQGEAPLQLAYIGPGKLKFEVRSIIRNVVDETATLLVQCGDTSKFLQNHTMFMAKQSDWLERGRRSTRAQQAIWMGPDKLRARQNMAQALGFYDMMATRGYERTELDRCLADNARAQQLQINTTADFADFGIRGTPSFALNGKTLEGVHSWQALAPQLNAQF